MKVSNIMTSFYDDEMFKNEFAIAFSLSIPFLISNDDDSCDVASLIYQSDIYDENNVECIGYLHYKDSVKYALNSVTTANSDSTFTLVKKADLKIESKQDYESVLSQIYDYLEEIRAFAFKTPNELSGEQKKCVANYTQLLRTLNSDKLLECYYAIEPLFCDWCCTVTINA
jgi:hypothetical protein